MDGKGNQRRGFRPPPRNPRHVPAIRVVPNMAIHRGENRDGNNNHMNNPGRLPPVSLPMHIAVFNQNQPVFPIQPGYVSLQPIHPQATHIAIPLNQACGGPPQHFPNGPGPAPAPVPGPGPGPVPVPNGAVHIGNMNPNMPGMIRVSAPPAPRIINGQPLQMRLNAPGFSRDQPVAGPSGPPTPNTYIVCPDGGLIAIPSSIYAAPTFTYFAMPIESQLGTITYAYTEEQEQMYAPAAYVPNGLHIIDEDELLCVGELQISEMDPYTDSD